MATHVKLVAQSVNRAMTQLFTVASHVMRLHISISTRIHSAKRLVEMDLTSGHTNVMMAI